MLQVVETPQKIAETINRFNPKYHDGFYRVRSLADAYLLDSSFRATSLLASSLVDVLKEWGAGKRKAPYLSEQKKVEALLESEHVKASLNNIAENLCSAQPSAGVEADFIELIELLSTELFQNNTNLTYPTKALLLLTGSFPGLDSQVRKGLANVGIRGFSSTQNLVFSLKNPKEAQKLLSLNRIFSRCWEQNAAVLSEGVKLSHYKHIAGYLHSPGRVFDILLFMGGSAFQFVEG